MVYRWNPKSFWRKTGFISRLIGRELIGNEGERKVMNQKNGSPLK
jgi:hypothetical protein